MTGKLIVIEAGDGCGKATQTAKLCRRLEQEGRRVRKVEFPDYQSQSSALIKMYLQGQFGQDVAAVNPYAASTFYAVDRFASYKTDWESFLKAGGIVVCDRYTTSNMVHQAVKLADAAARRSFLDWLWDFELSKWDCPCLMRSSCWICLPPTAKSCWPNGPARRALPKRIFMSRTRLT